MRRLISRICSSTTQTQVASPLDLSDNPKEAHLSHVISSESAEIYGGITAAVESPVAPSRQQGVEGKRSREASDQRKLAPSQSPIANNWSPSLQNVLDQPPATLPLRMLLGGLAFGLAFGAWAWLGQIEEVGHARGQLIPQGDAYKINPAISGKVARIAVKEGETVKAGQVLLELDSQIATNEVERLEQEQKSYQTQLLQTQALIDKTRLEAQTHRAIAQAKKEAQQATIQQAKAKVEGVQQTIAQTQEKIRTTTELLLQLRTDADAYQTRRAKLQPLTAIATERRRELQADVDAQQERLQRLQHLVATGAISKEYIFGIEQTLRDRQSAITQSELQEATNVKEQLFQADRALSASQRTITQTEGDLQQTTKELNRLQTDLQQTQAEFSRLQAEQNQNQAEARSTQIQNQQKIQQLEVQKTQLQAKADETAKLLSNAKTQLKQLAFTAPVDSVVLSLNVRNPGEVVQAGQTVAQLGPQEAPLVLAAKLPDREAGFVKTGMEVKVKLDSYPYQDYGIVSGNVVSISPDTQPDPQLGAVYRVEISLERHNVTAQHQTIPFKPGQTATADIIIRRRRIADILLDPIKQMQKGGIDL